MENEQPDPDAARGLIIERSYEPDDEAIDRAIAILLRDDVDHVARGKLGRLDTDRRLRTERRPGALITPCSMASTHRGPAIRLDLSRRERVADDEKREELRAREAWLRFQIGLGESSVVRRAAGATDERVREMHEWLARGVRSGDSDSLGVGVWAAIAHVADVVEEMAQAVGRDGTTWEACDRAIAADLDEIGIIVRRRSGSRAWVAFPEQQRCISYEVAELSRPASV